MVKGKSALEEINLNIKEEKNLSVEGPFKIVKEETEENRFQNDPLYTYNKSARKNFDRLRKKDFLDEYSIVPKQSIEYEDPTS
jgi:hypothetical protein